MAAVDGVARVQKVLLALFVVFLAACNTPPTEGRLEDAKIGEPPPAGVAQQKARAHLAQVLNEPDTAEIAFGSIRPGWYYPDSKLRYAWDLEVCVDDVNEFGLREGAKIHHFFFLGEELVAVASPDRVWYGKSYRYPYAIEEFGRGGLTAQEAGLIVSPQQP